METYIDSHIFNYTGQELKSIINKAIQYCKSLINNIKPLSNEEKISKFYDHIYIINYYYAMSGIMQLVSTDDIWNDIDIILETYINSFYKNKNIKIIIQNLVINNFEDKMFIDKLIKKFNECESSTSNKIKNNIKKLIVIIKNILENHKVLEITKEIQQYIPENNSSYINLNRSSYIYLQKRIKDYNIRNQIETEYFEKSENCLNYLSQIIILRSQFSVLHSCPNYFEYLFIQNNAETQDIKYLINDLNNKITIKTQKEILRFKKELLKDGEKRNIQSSDIIYYHEKLKCNNKFILKNVLQIIFNIIQENFGLIFKKINNQDNLWHQSIVTYEVYEKTQFIGLLYIDLLNRLGKSIDTPICVVLTHKYVHKFCNLNNPSQIVLLGNYKDFDSKILGYTEIILLFKEFGNIIQHLLYTNTSGLYHNDPEFNNMMPFIMEQFAWERTTIENLCISNGNNINIKILIDNIIFMRLLDLTLTIKIKCVNALFDHIIHSSSEIVNLLIENNSSAILLNLYKKIYADIMLSINVNFNTNINGIHPNVIIQEINGTEGLLFSNIICEIISFSIYHIIKHNKNHTFVNDVLKNNTEILKTAIYKFIRQIKNSYMLYIQELIGYSDIDTEKCIKENEKINVALSENTNYFNDDESDEENIIHIDRTL